MNEYGFGCRCPSACALYANTPVVPDIAVVCVIGTVMVPVAGVAGVPAVLVPAPAPLPDAGAVLTGKGRGVDVISGGGGSFFTTRLGGCSALTFFLASLAARASWSMKFCS